VVEAVVVVVMGELVVVVERCDVKQTGEACGVDLCPSLEFMLMATDSGRVHTKASRSELSSSRNGGYIGVPVF
jgi:hypothetical protein